MDTSCPQSSGLALFASFGRNTEAKRGRHGELKLWQKREATAPSCSWKPQKKTGKEDVQTKAADGEISADAAAAAVSSASAGVST